MAMKLAWTQLTFLFALGITSLPVTYGGPHGAFLGDTSSKIHTSFKTDDQIGFTERLDIENLKNPQPKLRQDRDRTSFVEYSGTYICCLIAALAGVAFAMVMMWAPQDQAVSVPVTEVAATTGKRNLQLDNAKILVSFLVVYGHFLFHAYWEDPLHSADTDSWLSGAGPMLFYLGDITTIPKMPLISFISGIMSRGGTNERRIRSFISNLVVPTLIWVFFVKPVLFAGLGNEHPVKSIAETLIQALKFQAFSAEWYLVSLIIWRASTLLLWSQLRPGVAFAIMMTLSCAAGYKDFNHPSYWFLALDQTFALLPYYGAGLTFPWADVCRIPEKWGYEWCLRAGTIVGYLTYATALYYYKYHRGFLIPDFHFAYVIPEDVSSADYALWWTRRLAKFVIETPAFLCVLLFVVPRWQTPLSWLGPHTLYPYVFHYLAKYWRDALIRILPLPTITSFWGHVLVLLLQVPYVLLVQMLFSSSYFRCLFSWCFHPTWLTRFMRISPKAADQHVHDLRTNVPDKAEQDASSNAVGSSS
mmetsp:Transcript_89729/g.155312  ORF Transcript_89729/g.155312 Transcript_89729/m.155312 type:complete len:530 (-) Transcript_89729:107-1696(-)